MRDLYETFGVEKPNHLPESPTLAVVLASTFCHLGGTFHIDADGKRRVMVPEPAAYNLNDEPLPSLPNAAPHEQFHRDDEYRGALKLVTALLRRLAPNDKTMVYDSLALVCTPLDMEQARKAMEARNG